jgi:hypothetical protein
MQFQTPYCAINNFTLRDQISGTIQAPPPVPQLHLNITQSPHNFRSIVLAFCCSNRSHLSAMVKYSPRQVEIRFLESIAVWIANQPRHPYYLRFWRLVVRRLDVLYTHRYWKRPHTYQTHLGALHNSVELGYDFKVTQKDIRLTIPELRSLASRLAGSEAFRSRGRKPQARIDVQLACFLYKLGNQSMSYYQTAQKFGLSGGCRPRSQS